MDKKKTIIAITLVAIFAITGLALSRKTASSQAVNEPNKLINTNKGIENNDSTKEPVQNIDSVKTLTQNSPIDSTINKEPVRRNYHPSPIPIKHVQNNY